ncbi:NADAR family protein [Aureispira sp. CCB-QB1]|uniref:NADAR family protein n=1 Tax=Aureispira sp. CCB-QB1 TaxID=1313421 RepID=UPI000695AD77|nr:NADAR family protein [Aureispira sp. CCB-QB1]
MKKANEKTKIRTYEINESCIFKKNKDKWGGLSNMATGFPITINSIKIKSSEALYQACKYPHNPELQQRILDQKSPFIAKMVTKGKITRDDWMYIRVNVMWWCIRLKLAHNLFSFGQLLASTRSMNIVENSTRDQFWGAKMINPNEFQGINALGRLLMELRERYYTASLDYLLYIPPMKLPNFFLIEENIKACDCRQKYNFRDLSKLEKDRIKLSKLSLYKNKK